MKSSLIKNFVSKLMNSSKAWLYYIIFFLGILAPIVVLGVVNYVHTNRDRIEDILDHKRALAYLASSIINERLDALVNLGDSLAMRPMVIDNVENNKWSEASDLLTSFIQQFPEVERIVLYDTDATIKAVIPAIPEAIGQSRADKEWYGHVKERWMPYVSTVYQSTTGPRANVISILIPIKAKSALINSDSSTSQEKQKILGLMQLEIKLNIFSKWIKDVNAGLGGFLYIVDQKGQIVYHPKFNSKDKIVNYSYVDLVQKGLREKRISFLKYYPSLKESHVGAFESVPRYDWGIIVTQPTAFAFVEKDKDLRTIVIVHCISFFSVFLFSILSFYMLLLQKRATDKISQLMRAVEQTPATIVITDIDGKIEYVNSAFEKISGYSFNEAKGQNSRVLKSGAQSSEFYQNLWQTIKSGNVWRGEFYNKKKSGEYFWEEASISPVKNEEGVITHFVAVKDDVTERKKILEQLDMKAKEWEDTFNAIDDLISIHDKNFKILRVNRAFADFFKKKPEDFIGKECFSVVHGLCVARADCSHKKVMETKKAHKSEYFEPRFNLYLEVTSSPIIKDDGNFYGTVHVIKNITDRKKSEEKEKVAMLAKSEFVSVVSHELRTPLTIIKESVSIVHEEVAGPINDKQKDFLETAKRNVDRLGRLINDVLDYQKLESQHSDLQTKFQSINEAVQEVEENFKLLVKSKGLSMVLNLEHSLPSILFDRDKIIQVLTNLVNNAIKFSKQGTITIITQKISDNALQVTIQDQGVGIKQEDFSKLFIAFSQISSGMGRQTGGTGLGLSLSKKIIEAHNGKVGVFSKIGEGATFYFILPINDRRQEKEVFYVEKDINL